MSPGYLRCSKAYRLSCGLRLTNPRIYVSHLVSLLEKSAPVKNIQCSRRFGYQHLFAHTFSLISAHMISS